MYGWDHGCAGFFPILVCIALTLLACFLVSRFLCGGSLCGTKGAHGKNVSEESAQDILKARYAMGEIGREEFERMKQEIKER